MSEIVFEELCDAIVGLKADKAREIVQKGIDDGLDPVEIVKKGIRGALDLMGKKFASGDVFLPELMFAAKVAEAAVAVLEPEILKRGVGLDKSGKVLLATVKGDMHDIGKNIVALVMKSAGFEVYDIGVDKTNEEILEIAKKYEVDVIGLSALLTTTMPRMKEMVELLQKAGFQDRYKVIIGGAPVTQDFANTIGADGYGADAPSAVEVTKRLLGK